MSGWTQCPSCRLKHTARPDGLCPRCRQPVSGFGAAPPRVAAPAPAWSAVPEAAAAPPFDAFPAPPPAPAPWAPPARTHPTSARQEVEVGRLLSATFSIWSRNAGAVIPLVLLANVPVALAMFRAYAQFPGEPTNERLVASGAFWGAMAINLLINPVELFGVAHAGVRRMRGDRVELGELLGASARRYFPALALWLLLLLALSGTGCTIVFPFILLTAWAAALPAMSEEGLGPVEALRRSWHLTKGHRWRIFASLFVLQLIVGLGVVAVQAVIGVVVRSGDTVTGATAGAFHAFDTMLQSVSSSIVTTGLAVAYRHLRDAQEGPAVVQLERVFE